MEKPTSDEKVYENWSSSKKIEILDKRPDFPAAGGLLAEKKFNIKKSFFIYFRSIDTKWTNSNKYSYFKNGLVKV